MLRIVSASSPQNLDLFWVIKNYQLLLFLFSSTNANRSISSVSSTNSPGWIPLPLLTLELLWALLCYTFTLRSKIGTPLPFLLFLLRPTTWCPLATPMYNLASAPFLRSISLSASADGAVFHWGDVSRNTRWWSEQEPLAKARASRRSRRYWNSGWEEEKSRNNILQPWNKES